MTSTSAPVPRSVSTSSPQQAGTKRIALGTALALLVSGALSLGASAPVHATDGDAPATVSELVMTGEGQQRWQSLPKSRLVLNPFDRYARGSNGSLTRYDSEVFQNSGPHLPVRAAYYANDEALRFPNLLTTYRAGSGGSSPGTTVLDQPYTTANGWTNDRATAASDGTQTTITVNSGNSFGGINKTVTVDLEATPLITVDVAALSADAQWAFEVGSTKFLPTDSTATGQHTYNLAAALDQSGVQNLALKIWVAGGTGKAVTLNSLTLHGDADANPAHNKSVLWRDEFSSAADWYEGSQGAQVSSNGAQGLVSITADGRTQDYGSGGKDFTVDVTTTTRVAVKVDSVSHVWALQVRDGGDSKSIQQNTTATGWTEPINLASLVGTGTKNLQWRLFTSGNRPSGVLVDEIIVWDEAVNAPWTEPAALVSADSFETTWTASAQTFTGDYGSAGTITGRDVFTSTEAIVREVDTRALTGDAVVGGLLQGTPTWDNANKRLTVTNASFVQVYQFPASATVTFGATIATATGPATSGSAAWATVIPSGAVHKVAIAFAPVSRHATFAPEMTTAAATSAATGEAQAAFNSDLDDRIDELDEFWNDYLAKVPRPTDFSLHAVPGYGTTEADIRAAYYRAWINLQQNVIPATPETNSMKAQLGTGKASMWMSGIPGAKNVATWDTLVGLQTLVHADPELAWESFTGIMDFVQTEGDFVGEITNDPAKGGEVLPSRKAQTAWVLYNATGDRTKLEAIYPKLKLVLEFAKTNLHWTVKDRGTYNYEQRDSEFVTSLILDLEHAKKIATLLGETADVTQWATDQDDLYDKFDTWFLQNGTFVQKVNLSRDDDLFASDPKPGGYTPATVTGVNSNGDTSVVATSLALPGLSSNAKQALLGRLEDPSKPGVKWAGGSSHFAGLGDNIKGPNMNYFTKALLDEDHVSNGLSKATQFNESIIRDVVRSGWFAEVYQGDGNGTSDKPLVDGVRPSLFGIAAFVDAVWINNGFRISLGDPSFVQLSNDNNGGITGLSVQGKSLDISLGSEGVTFGGEIFDRSGPCVAVPVTPGETIELPQQECSFTEPVGTTTTLSLSTSEQIAGDAPGRQAVATITVTPNADGSPAPAGQVSLDVVAPQATNLGTATLAQGAATLTVPADLAVGTYTLRASFIPAVQDEFAPSQSAPVTLTVKPQSTQPPVQLSPVGVALSMDKTKIAVGSRPTATVTVSTAGVWTSGVATITVNGQAVARVSVPASKRATVRLPAITQVGRHSISAQVAATSTSLAGASPTLTLRSVKAKPKVKIKAKKKIKLGKKIKVTVRVKAPAGLNLKGKARVKVGKHKARTVKVNAKGRANVKIKVTKRGKQKIRVKYQGSSHLKKANKAKNLRVR